MLPFLYLLLVIFLALSVPVGVRLYPQHRLLQELPVPAFQLLVGVDLSFVMGHVVENEEKNFVWK